MRRLWLPLLMTVVFSCAGTRTGWIGKLERGDYSAIEVGRYPHWVDILRPPTEYDETIEELRGSIERDPRLMNRVAEHFFPEGEGDIPNLRFRFKFIGTDEKNRRLILRYFALIPDPFVFAGYQCQFVFELPSERFDKVYVDQIPLE